jgi:hypothetical protein
LSFLGPKKSVKNKELFFLLLIKFVGRREREKNKIKIKIHQILDIIFKNKNPEMKITS